MRVLLVGPDSEDNLSIRYLSAALRARGHIAELSAFNSAKDHDGVVADARGFDVVGLSMCFQSRALEYFALAAALKQAGCPMVVMGGHYATCEAEEIVTRHRAVDVIAIHEGEHTLVELVEAGPDRRRWGTVAGVVYREHGMVRRTGQRRAIEDLDELPHPDRRGAIHVFAGVPTAYLLGSRGCVARCDYCCIVTLHKMAPGKKYRRRDPANVVEEMATLYHERGIRQFIFHDDNFLVPSRTKNHERLDAYERAFERHGLHDIGFTIKCRPPDAERSVFERLKRMGLLRVFFGIESASEAGLESIGRDQTVAESAHALELARELDISSQYTMMMFHPDATPATVRADLAFLRAHIDHALNFCRTEIYSGTPLEQRMIAEGRARGDYLARTYDVADAGTDRACTAALNMFGERCWSMGGLMERVIGMDHIDGVVGRFYDGALAARWRRTYAALRRRANEELVELLGEVIDRAAAAPSIDDARFVETFRALCAREREGRAALLAACDAQRALLDDVVLPGIGATRDARASLHPVSPAAGLARHAAAFAMAFAVAACNARDGAGARPPEAPHAPGLVHAPVAPPDEPQPVADAGPPDAPPIAPPPEPPAEDAGPPPPNPPKLREHDGISEFAPGPLLLHRMDTVARDDEPE